LKEEIKNKAQKEFKEVIQWVLEEEDKVTNQLKKEGKYIGGLDTNHDDYAYIYKERDIRIAKIKEKYNIN